MHHAAVCQSSDSTSLLTAMLHDRCDTMLLSLSFTSSSYLCENLGGAVRCLRLLFSRSLIAFQWAIIVSASCSANISDGHILLTSRLRILARSHQDRETPQRSYKGLSRVHTQHSTSHRSSFTITYLFSAPRIVAGRVAP